MKKPTGRILVGNLVSEIDEASISGLFLSAEGTVVSVDVPVDRKSGKGRGYAFVQMSTECEAQKAIEQLDGSEVCGRRVSLTMAEAEVVKRNGRWYLFGL